MGNLIDKVYDKYETFDFEYGQDNLNPLREIAAVHTESVSDSIERVYELIKKRVEQIDKDTKPLIEKELNDNVTTGISPFEASSGKDTAQQLAAAKAGTPGDYIFPGVSPKYVDSSLNLQIQLLMSQLTTMLDKYPDETGENPENPVNSLSDGTFVDSTCDIGSGKAAKLTAIFSKKKNTVSLQWTRVSNASYYKIQRKMLADSSYTELDYVIKEASVISYAIEDTNLEYSTTYSYKVVPYDKDGNALTESNVEEGTTITDPDSGLFATYSETTHKVTVNWQTFLDDYGISKKVALTAKAPWKLTIQGESYYFIRFEIYRGTESKQKNLFVSDSLFAANSDIDTGNLSDSTQLTDYPDTNINYVVGAVLATEEQLTALKADSTRWTEADGFTSDIAIEFSDIYKRVWSGVAGCTASYDSDSSDSSTNSSDSSGNGNGNDEEQQALLDLISATKNSNDESEKNLPTDRTIAACAKQDLAILSMILGILRVISIVMNIINLVIFISSQLISIVQLAAACWNNPSNIGKIVQMVLERVMAIVMSLIGKLIATMMDKLHLDCVTDMTADILNEIQTILNSVYNLSTTSVLTPLNMANSTWNSIKQVSSSVTESFKNNSKKVTELKASVESGVKSALSSNPIASEIVTLVDGDNIDWTKLTSLIKGVPELSGLLGTVDTLMDTVKSATQYKNIGTEWKNATSKWTW